MALLCRFREVSVVFIWSVSASAIAPLGPILFHPRFRSVSVEFVWSALASALAPSGSMSLPDRFREVSVQRGSLSVSASACTPALPMLFQLRARKVSVVLILSALASACAPSEPMALLCRFREVSVLFIWSISASAAAPALLILLSDRSREVSVHSGSANTSRIFCVATSRVIESVPSLESISFML